MVIIPAYKPSLHGVYYGKLLLEALPEGQGVARVDARHQGKEGAMQFSIRRCSRYYRPAGELQTTVRELTGGVVVGVCLPGANWVGYWRRGRQLSLRPGWTEKSVVRAATRLHAWAVVQWERAALIAQLDAAAEVWRDDQAFGAAVEAQEQVWGVSDYTSMTEGEIERWIGWVRAWAPVP